MGLHHCHQSAHPSVLTVVCTSSFHEGGKTLFKQRDDLQKVHLVKILETVMAIFLNLTLLMDVGSLKIFQED